MKLTKEILDAAYNGFVAPDGDNESEYGLDWDQLKSDDIKKLVESLVAFGINPMFNELGLDNCKREITVKLLNKEAFAYTAFLDTYSTIAHTGLDNLKNNAVAFCSEKFKMNDDDSLSFIERNYGTDYGMGIVDFNLIIINKSIVTKTFGLHLICHEIMHLLANQETVAEMRGKNPNFQDEAVNEYFARLAMCFYINSTVEEQENRRKIAGLTYFHNDLFVNHPQHNRELGLYGKLMYEDKYMINKKWDKMTDDKCVDYIKLLAQFYFGGGTDPLK